MVIDFQDSNVKKIDSIVSQLYKFSGGQFTKGQFRSFIVDFVLSKYSDSELLDLIISNVKDSKYGERRCV